MIATPYVEANRPGYPIEIQNDIRGTRKIHYTTLTRGEAVENLMWACGRSTEETADEEPFSVCVYIFPDRIVMRFYCPWDKDPERARAAMDAMVEDGEAAV